MAKSPFNIQDQYLNQARKERVQITVLLILVAILVLVLWNS